MNHSGARKIKRKYKRKKYRLQRKHTEKFLFIHLTDNDIDYYSPEYCDNLEDALHKIKGDIERIARKEGYTQKDVFRPNINDIYRRIRERWEE